MAALIEISNLYKFYYLHPSLGQVECKVDNNSLKWIFKREKKQRFSRKYLDTELVFGNPYFAQLQALERTNFRCERVVFEVHRLCEGSYELFWKGYLALIDGEYDLDRCTLKIKARIDDQYSCLLKNWNKEKDFIGGVGAPTEVVIKYTQGEIENIACQAFVYPVYEVDVNGDEILVLDPNAYSLITNCLTAPLAQWGLIGHTVVELQTTSDVLVATAWGREVLTTSTSAMPQGDGWILISTNNIDSWTWSRPAGFTESDFIVPPLQNGRKLVDVLQFLLDDCNLTLKSNFFNKNPDGTNPTNFAYDYALEYLQDIVIYSKSDIRRTKKRVIDGTALDVQYATKANVKLKDLLTWLNYAFNVNFIAEENGNFILEHYTFFKKYRYIDLTQAELKPSILGQHKYKYNKEELPISEKWTWMENTGQVDFDAPAVGYKDTCSYDDDELNEAEYPISGITTNIDYIINHNENISDAGFCLVATKYDTIISSTGLISQSVRINMPLSLANLLYHLHRHGRPQRGGVMNNQEESFYQTVPQRSQEGISFKMCCSDLNRFNMNDMIKTQLGWGEISQAQFVDPSSVMQVNLLMP